MRLTDAFRNELVHALRARRDARMDESRLYAPSARVFVGGAFVHRVNGRDERIDANLVVNEGLNYLLDAALSQGAVLGPFYVALIGGNVAPTGTWTAASFPADASEFTAYNESARRPWSEAGPQAQAIGNAASPAQFTITTDGSNVYGAALISSQAKGATTGKLLCAARFDTPRLGLAANDKLSIEYTLTLANDL